MREHLEELKLGGRPMTKLEKANKEIERKDYLLKEQGKELKDLHKEIERLHSIIKEVGEYTNDLLKLKENDYFDLVDKSYIKKYLEILDKAGKNNE